MSRGRQVVVWNGVESNSVGMVYGVRQGSILGPLLYNVHVADMPACLDVGEEYNTGYANNTGAWQVGYTLEDVAASLQRIADRFSAYTKGNGLSLNAAKTQLMFNKKADGCTVVVDGAVINPASSLELLGVRYDQHLTTRPYVKALVKAVRMRASLISRLGHHLPRGQLLRQVSASLGGGKINHALAAVVAPRLPGTANKATGDLADLQIACNNVARTVTGGKPSDKLNIETLLERANLPSVNAMVVAAVGMEAWKAHRSRDSGNGNKNPVGAMLFDGAIGSAVDNNRSLRAATAGHIRVPLRGCDTFITNAAALWNVCPA
jgi:hypothetical protein